MKKSVLKLIKQQVDQFHKVSIGEEEAWSRSHFVDELNRYIGAGNVEYFCSVIAHNNGQVHWVKKWMNEAERLVKKEFVRALGHSVKGTKDYDKAFLEAKDDVLQSEKYNIGMALGHVRKCYPKISIIENVSDKENFWQMVEAVYQEAKKINFPIQTEKKPSIRGKSF